MLGIPQAQAPESEKAVDADDLPDCPECQKLAIEDIAEFVTDPENLARLDPEEALEIRASLRKLLNRPDDTLEELAKILATEVKKRVGIFEQ